MGAINEWTGGKAKTGGRMLNSFLRRLAERTVLGDCSGVLNEKIIAGLKGDELILDIGAGSGYYSMQMAKRLTGGRVYCLDGSTDMLAILRRLADRRGLSGRIVPIHGNADSSGLGDSSMDIVSSFALFHELSDPAPVLAEMNRVLRPGGTMVIGDFSRRYAHRHPGTFGGWEREDMEKQMLATGLTGVSVVNIKRWLFATGRKS